MNFTGLSNNKICKTLRHGFFHRLLSVFMVFVLICGILPAGVLTAFAETGVEASSVTEEVTGKVLTITTSQQLLDLAEGCTLDTFSQGLTVSLEADIDLNKTGFRQIPIFQGTFLGHGHTISGFETTRNEVNSGFFGILTEEATVSDLVLEGKVCPKGVLDCVGGLAGRNNGLISGCCFKGTVSYGDYSSEIESEQSTGGICGINGEEGSIVNCHTEGSVEGLKYTGGISGLNYGCISHCVNLSEVNTSVKDRSASLSELFDLKSIDDLMERINLKKMYASEDTGGISGCSSGMILYSYNESKVGTADNGYNVGGIAGCTDGFIYACENHGEIQGNTNVGGITGQLEPSIRITNGKTVLSKEDLHGVFDSMDDLIASVSSDISDVSGMADLVLNDLDGALQSVTDMENALTDIVNVKLDETGQITGVANDVIANVNAAMDTVETVTGGLENMAVDAVGMAESIDDAMGHAKNAGQTIAESTSSIVDSAGEAISDISEELNANQFKVTAEIPDKQIEYLDKLVEIQVMVLKTSSGTTEIADCFLLNSENNWASSSGRLPYFNESTNEVETYYIYFYPVAKDGTAGVCYYIDANAQTTYDNTQASNYKISINGISAESLPEVKEEKEEVTIEIQWQGETGLIDKHPDSLLLYLNQQALVGVFHCYETVEIQKTDRLSSDRNIWRMKTQLPVEYADGTAIDYANSFPSPVDLKKIKYVMTGVTYDSASRVLTIQLKADDSGKSSVTEVISKVSSIVSKASSIKTIVEDTGKEIGENVADLLTNSTAELNYTLGEFKHATSYLETLTADLANVMYQISALELQDVRSIPEFSELGPELDQSMEELQGHLSDLLGHISDINGKLDMMQQSASSDLRSIVGNVSDISDTVFDLLSDVSLSLEKLLGAAYDDTYTVDLVNETDTELTGNEGCLMKCKNEGAVRALTVAGGIVGTIAISRVPSILKDSTETDLLSVPAIKYTALVRDCESRCIAEAYGDYVGLICGKQKMGAIVNCSAAGQAVSSNGNYVGGIAGLSHANITSCSVRGRFSGTYYVGGIAGTTSDKETVYQASELKDCSVFAEEISAQQYSGAISGSTLGGFENNTFVEGEYQGVCGLSVSGSYSPVSESTFAASDQTLAAYEIPQYQRKQLYQFNYSKWIKIGLVLLLLLLLYLVLSIFKERRLAKLVVSYINRDNYHKARILGSRRRKGNIPMQEKEEADSPDQEENIILEESPEEPFEESSEKDSFEEESSEKESSEEKNSEEKISEEDSIKS